MINNKPEIIFRCVFGFLIFSFLLIFLIDIVNIFNIRSVLFTNQEVGFLGVYWRQEVDYFWIYWWSVPIEKPLQWIFLAGALTSALLITQKARLAQDKEIFTLWLLLSVGLFFMLLEDAVDIRHIIRAEIAEYTGEGSYGLYSTLFELFYFSSLAAIFIYAFLRYRTIIWQYSKTKTYLIAGYIFYAIAVGSSWLGSAFRSYAETDIYTIVGNSITSFLFKRNRESIALFNEANEYMASLEYGSLEYFFMDRVYEESIELLGAGAFLVAAMAFYSEYQKRKNSVSGAVGPEFYSQPCKVR